MEEEKEEDDDDDDEIVSYNIYLTCSFRESAYRGSSWYLTLSKYYPVYQLDKN